MEGELIKQLIMDAVALAFPKQWLTKKEFCKEFGISSTTVWELINDHEDPLPYSSLGKSKQLFNRNDINAFLERRKRNNG